MASTTDIIFWGSLAGLLALTIRGFRRSRHVGQLSVSLAVLAASGTVYGLVFDRGPHLGSKGGQSSATAFIVLYACMLAGMACNYLYRRFMQPQSGRELFDWGRFIAPMFASPLLFAPLWSAFQDAGVTVMGLRFSAFLVAFQNGFFWKEFFDNIRRRRS